MRISIVGTGYVGLVTGVCLAEKGHLVTCVDKDNSKVEKICSGVSPIFEVGLERLLKKNIGSTLFATTDLHSSVINSEVTFIAVGTPFNGVEIDLTFIKEVSLQIGNALHEKPSYHLVVVKSTVIPGTTDYVVTPIIEQASGRKAGCDLGISMNPEFLTEGQAIEDFMSPDRIIFGGNDEKAINSLEQVYSDFKGVKKISTNNMTAEMIKYASNSMLATCISFANEIGNLCSALGGIDAVDVMNGLHLSKYLNPRSSTGEYVPAPLAAFFEAGCGFGGSCLPKDVNALVAQGKKKGLQMSLLSAVIQINLQQPKRILEILKGHFPSIRDLRVAVLGLAFKPETDDVRLSPAIPIIQYLLSEGAAVNVYDPVACSEAKKIFDVKAVKYHNSLSAVVKDVDAVILVTKWEEFKKLPTILKNLNKQPVVIDGRRMLCKTSVAKYDGIGL